MQRATTNTVSKTHQAINVQIVATRVKIRLKII